MKYEAIGELLNREEEHLKERIAYWLKRYKNNWAYLDILLYDARLFELEKIRAIIFEFSKRNSKSILIKSEISNSTQTGKAGS